MKRATEQILTVAQMCAAEEELIDSGTSVDALMQIAGQGAAEWIYRLAWPRPVTVLCGPGNNGGDGYVIAQSLRSRHLPVVVVAPLEPATEAAKHARAAYGSDIWALEELPQGAILVDCLFGSGLTRPLSEDLYQLLKALSYSHAKQVAVDLPSGVDSDSGQPLNDDLPQYDLTIGLGAWKFAHWTMPAAATMGERHLVPIGVESVRGAARLLARPALKAPAVNAHKYTRGLVVVVAGVMPGASVLACSAAMHGGAGYVKLVADAAPPAAPADLVVDSAALADQRISALLIGPGLGRSEASRAKLAEALARNLPTVLDADALVLLTKHMLAERTAPIIATPHEGELVALAKTFGIVSSGKRAVALDLARESGMIVIAKGPDTMIAAPDGKLAIARPGPSWLSVAGTGDVLAGLVASRLGAGSKPFDAACEAVWLHGEAARRSGPAFSATDLIGYISAAYDSSL
jgi:hydroxyethylthiazole kinase-like uncharacterized protein yjeF